MYPLNMTLIGGIGFAVANDKTEHQSLTAAGYGPAYVAPAKSTKTAGGAGTDTTPADGE